jgi:hypothetical protein
MSGVFRSIDPHPPHSSWSGALAAGSNMWEGGPWPAILAGIRTAPVATRGGGGAGAGGGEAATVLASLPRPPPAGNSYFPLPSATLSSIHTFSCILHAQPPTPPGTDPPEGPPAHRPPLVRGKDTLAGWRGGRGSIVWKTPDTTLYSTYVRTLWLPIPLIFFGLKVHKNENCFGSDFEFCTISLLVMFKY